MSFCQELLTLQNTTPPGCKLITPDCQCGNTGACIVLAQFWLLSSSKAPVLEVPTLEGLKYTSQHLSSCSCPLWLMVLCTLQESFKTGYFLCSFPGELIKFCWHFLRGRGVLVFGCWLFGVFLFILFWGVFFVCFEGGSCCMVLFVFCGFFWLVWCFLKQYRSIIKKKKKKEQKKNTYGAYMDFALHWAQIAPQVFQESTKEKKWHLLR